MVGLAETAGLAPGEDDGAADGGGAEAIGVGAAVGSGPSAGG